MTTAIRQWPRRKRQGRFRHIENRRGAHAVRALPGKTDTLLFVLRGCETKLFLHMVGTPRRGVRASRRDAPTKEEFCLTPVLHCRRDLFFRPFLLIFIP